MLYRYKVIFCHLVDMRKYSILIHSPTPIQLHLFLCMLILTYIKYVVTFFVSIPTSQFRRRRCQVLVGLVREGRLGHEVRGVRFEADLGPLAHQRQTADYNHQCAHLNSGIKFNFSLD